MQVWVDGSRTKFDHPHNPPKNLVRPPALCFSNLVREGPRTKTRTKGPSYSFTVHELKTPIKDLSSRVSFYSSRSRSADGPRTKISSERHFRASNDSRICVANGSRIWFAIGSRTKNHNERNFLSHLAWFVKLVNERSAN